MEQRFAAILVAAMVGYSRPLGEERARTLAALQAHRRKLIEPNIAALPGRTVKLMRDGALVESAAIVDRRTGRTGRVGAEACRQFEPNVVRMWLQRRRGRMRKKGAPNGRETQPCLGAVISA